MFGRGVIYMLIDNIEKYLHNILYPSIFSVVGTCTPNNPNGLSTFGLHVFSPVVSAWFRLASPRLASPAGAWKQAGRREWYPIWGRDRRRKVIGPAVIWCWKSQNGGGGEGCHGDVSPPRGWPSSREEYHSGRISKASASVWFWGVGGEPKRTGERYF